MKRYNQFFWWMVNMTPGKIVVQSGLCHFEDLGESAALQYLGRKLPLFEREVHTDIFTFPIIHHHLYFAFFSWLYRCLCIRLGLFCLSFFAFVFIFPSQSLQMFTFPDISKTSKPLWLWPKMNSSECL